MSIPNPFQPSKQAKMKTTYLAPGNLFIAFLPIYFFYWDAMAIFYLFKNILSKTEKKIKEKNPNSPHYLIIIFLFFNTWSLNMDTYRMEAHYCNRCHYNLSPALQ